MTPTSLASLSVTKAASSLGSLAARLLPMLLLLPARAASEGGLSDYVQHHQMLHYTPLSAGRGRRSTAPPLQLQLPTGDRVLTLRLVPDTSTLAPDIVYSGPSGSTVGTDSLTPLFTGWVLGEPGSALFGGLVDGVFDGTIELANETLVVERTSLHMHGGPHGHSFVYRASDMLLPPAREGDRPCGVRDGHDPLVWDSDKHKATTVPSEEDRQPRQETVTLASVMKHWRSSTGRGRLKRRIDDHDGDHGSGHNEDAEPDEVYNKHHDGAHSRTLCSVYVETDPKLWQEIFRNERGSLRRTETFLQWLAGSHVQGVNRIFKQAIFDGRHHHHEYQFQIQKLVVSDDHTCLPNYSGVRNRLCFDHTNSQTYLEAHSDTNFDSFCLAFAISYHDFEQGTIGLAWIGAPWEGAGRGVCARHAAQAFYNWETGVIERKWRSLNTAMITLLNFGRPVHPLQSQLTLAHEIGHTMGSPHDQGALGTSANISRVLDYITDGLYFNCFAVKGSAFCGNGVVETGEQCDCGFTAHDCRDRCCWPRHPPAAAGSPKKARCQYQPGAVCSPSQGPCCDPVACATVPAEANHTCRAGTECTLPALCDGRSLQCPAVDEYGRADALTEADVGGDRSQLCVVGCHAHSGAPCRPRNPWLLEAGDPCDGDRGACDSLLRCRPLEAAATSAGRWWLATVVALLLAVVCALLLRCVALHIPSSNPNKPPPRPMSETLRVPLATFFGLSGGGDLQL
ncbi:disintegrin and metalloproteinase domain-containing protein 10-like [Amphibalanus amphitrite]|uniref:disintegrin and metalloproteinase domain-containing protein 10-like n=1 Tax=Amphibalanus amphitrite TaxID=1232801 RepID=UPI001C914B26|nr:disintegrin and metalloproteinase domain-containing protein 10-like [Amphibalanus amphitrite]